jgi:hypothetical protein
MYSKYQKTFDENPNYSHPIADQVVENLRHHLRIEFTVKYNWFGTNRSVANWKDVDWTLKQRELFHKFLGRHFHLDYVMSCPNVYADNYTEGWTRGDRRAFASWQRGTQPDSRVTQRLYKRHGFDATLSLDGHRNLLWNLLRPNCLRVPSDVDLRKVRSTVGHRLFEQHLPLIDQLTAGANTLLLRKIDGLCGI